MSEEADGSPFKTGLNAEIWDTAALVKWSDEVRASLGTGSSLSDEQMEVMSTLLNRLLDDEKLGNPPSLVFIAKTRFDLLVREILSFGANQRDRRPNLQAMEMLCFALQRVWRKHFKLSSFVSMIEEVRQRRMEEISLKNVELDIREGKWVVDDANPDSYSQVEGSINFEPGQWWLNLACCYRDGIVGHMLDDMTKGPYGPTAIPLLSGEELESSLPDCFTYRRTGPIEDMYVSIMSKLGQRSVRLLRGYKLKSPYAPKGGIRYDGLYTPVEYSHKLDVATNTYEVKLLFKRNRGTPAAEVLLQVPSPSQMDEWKLYLVTAANEREINRSPNRIRLTPQGNEPRSSALLASPEFLEALKSESPSSALAPPDPSTPTPIPRKQRESGAVAASEKLNEVLSEGSGSEASSPPSAMSVFAQISTLKSAKRIKTVPQGNVEPSSASVKESLAPHTPPKTLAIRKAMFTQGNEERDGFMRSSDSMNLSSRSPDDSSTQPAPQMPSKVPVKKKMITQDNEERGGLVKSSSFMDMLNDGPDEGSSPSVKSSPTSGKKAPPTAKKSTSVKGKAGTRDSGIGGVTEDDVFSDKKKSTADEPPAIIKKRGKTKDPYDIDEMMSEVERGEEERIAAEEEERKRGPKA